MSDILAAVDALTGPRRTIREASAHVPNTAGLYAIYGDAAAWKQLGLERRPDDLLYVGKAEESLVSRDLHGHFAIDPSRRAQTGSSTVRRSFAALLHDELELRGIPRSPAKPGHFSNYGLSEQHDTALTTWMHQRLTLAVWPATGSTPLRVTEGDIIAFWTPPLNLSGNPRPAPGLSAARSRMAAEARAWRAGN